MRGEILVIEDDAALRGLFVAVLRGAGYRARGAADGAEALDLLWVAGGAQPDLILLDLNMPRLDGRSFLRLYHQKPWPHAPVVVVSSAQLDQRTRPHVAAKLGKPVDLDVFLGTVERCRRRAAAA